MRRTTLILGVVIAAIIIGAGYEIYAYNVQVNDLQGDLSNSQLMYYNLNNTHQSLVVDYQNLTDRFQNLTDQYSSLTIAHTNLQTQFNNLSASYETLSSNYTVLSANYGVLLVNYTAQLNSYLSLQSQYNGLDANYSLLQSQYNGLNTNYNSLQSSYNTLLAKYDALLNQQPRTVTFELSAQAVNGDPYLRYVNFNIDSALTFQQIVTGTAQYSWTDSGSTDHVITVSLLPGTHYLYFGISAFSPWYWTGTVTGNGQVLGSVSGMDAYHVLYMAVVVS